MILYYRLLKVSYSYHHRVDRPKDSGTRDSVKAKIKNQSSYTTNISSDQFKLQVFQAPNDIDVRNECAHIIINTDTMLLTAYSFMMLGNQSIQN